MGINIKESLKKIKKTIHENSKKSTAVILVGIYAIMTVLLNLAPIFYSGVISITLYFQLLLIFINVPVLMILSIVLTGRWRNIVTEIEHLKNIHGLEITHINKVHDLNKEVAIKTMELINIQETYAHFKSIEEFKRLLRIERRLAELKIQLAALKGERIVDSLIANEDWIDANDAIGAIEELRKSVQEECEEIIVKNDNIETEPGIDDSKPEENSI